MKEVHSESIHLQESCHLIKQTGALAERVYNCSCGSVLNRDYNST